MDITIEGFHSWMWRGLSFLLPFLFVGYFFQLYNAYTLYTLVWHPEATWHVPVLSLMFFVLFLGNITTTIMVIPQKLQDRFRDHLHGVFVSKVQDRKKDPVKHEEEKPEKIDWIHLKLKLKVVNKINEGAGSKNQDYASARKCTNLKRVVFLSPKDRAKVEGKQLVEVYSWHFFNEKVIV